MKWGIWEIMFLVVVVGFFAIYVISSMLRSGLTNPTAYIVWIVIMISIGTWSYISGRKNADKKIERMKKGEKLIIAQTKKELKIAGIIILALFIFTYVIINFVI